MSHCIHIHINRDAHKYNEESMLIDIKNMKIIGEHVTPAYLPSLLRVFDFVSWLLESFNDFIEPVGLLVYCNFSGDVKVTSALPTT